MTILVLDDSKSMRLIVKRLLIEAGLGNHNIIEASDGNYALEIIEKESPDLVLTDLIMPNMSGFDFLDVLNKNGKKINVGFITSDRSEEKRQQALEKGAKFFLSKPLSADILKSAISEVGV